MRLKKYIKTSNITVVKIKFEGKTYLFNLESEVKIDREVVSNVIHEHPSKYSFILMLHKKIIGLSKRVELDMNVTYSRCYLKYLTSKKSQYFKEMGTYPTPTIAKELAMKDPEYVESVKRYIELEEQKDTLEACVKAFENRASLLQTLSANNRKERN